MEQGLQLIYKIQRDISFKDMFFLSQNKNFHFIFIKLRYNKNTLRDIKKS